ETIDAPVICTPGGNSAFPYEHPLSLGGWIEDRYVTEVLEEADVVVAIGTALGEVSSNYFTMQPRGQVIQIDAHVRVLESNYPGIGIRADAGIALADIVSGLEKHGTLSASQWDDQTSAQLVVDVRKNIEQRLHGQDLAHELGVLDAIRIAVPDDAL